MFRIIFTVGCQCGPTYYSHLRFAHLGFIQLLSFVYSSKQQCFIQIFRESAGTFLLLVYFFLGQWHQPPTLSRWPVDTQRYWGKKKKMAFCEIVKSCSLLEERSSPRAELQRAHRVPTHGWVCVNVEQWKCWRNAKGAINSSDGCFSLWVQPE